MAKLYPPIKPYRKGYLKVSGGHDLYYELVGNPKGIPVLYLHGGPGAGIWAKDRRYFNPRKFNVLLFDQRGSGKSKPFASTKNNTTWKLVEDINALLNHLEINKVLLFGGSWGSTLALVYAIKHPERVKALILRGIFLGTKKELDYFYKGGPQNNFPESWERFISLVPKTKRKNPLNFYAKNLKSKNKKLRQKYCTEFSRYEFSAMKLSITEKELNKLLKGPNNESYARIGVHYFLNRCFLPDDYILKNIYKIKNLPIIIVHGRYDFICLPKEAYKLHKAIKGSKLYFVTAGHSSSDKNLEEKLVEEMDKFAK